MGLVKLRMFGEIFFWAVWIRDALWLMGFWASCFVWSSQVWAVYPMMGVLVPLCAVALLASLSPVARAPAGPGLAYTHLSPVRACVVRLPPNQSPNGAHVAGLSSRPAPGKNSRIGGWLVAYGC
jgi:hypothetical protein